MSSNIIDNFLVASDNVLDYVPFVSTFVNLVDLFQKHMFRPLPVSLYSTHLQQKHSLRCVTLLFPVVGNIVVGAVDIFYWKYNHAPTAAEHNAPHLETAPQSDTALYVLDAELDLTEWGSDGTTRDTVESDWSSADLGGARGVDLFDSGSESDHESDFS